MGISKNIKEEKGSEYESKKTKKKEKNERKRDKRKTKQERKQHKTAPPHAQAAHPGTQREVDS